MSLPQIGADGQARLRESSVALIGAGGLGSPVALYLAAAGVGHLTLIDDDRVERSNLHRQIVHADDRVGQPKVLSAQRTLQALNPSIEVRAREGRLHADNAEDWLLGHDVVVDGADNFPTRYVLADACQALALPMVYAAIDRFSGQASVFDPQRPDSPCYRCLFPDPPAAGDAPNCAEAGVLGVLPGLLGTIQATEVLKLLLDIGEPLVGRVLNVDALTMRFHELRLRRDPDCPGCGPRPRPARIEAGCASL
jgi:sulfur-carrier protein adenylyltransferase/sulfurtransferase